MSTDTMIENTPIDKSTIDSGTVAPGPAAATASAPTEHPLRMVARLTTLELRLMVREPMVIVGLLGLPIVAMVVIGGVFGQTPTPEFNGVAPDDYYVASYLGVVLASLGLVTLPVHIATNRELGVTRRYRASGIGTTTIVATQMALGLVLGVVSSAVMLVIGHLVYGLEAPDNLAGVVGWYALGLVCFVAVGGALGVMVRGGRSANALGNLLFLPTFLLGGGGPPREVMNSAMRAVSDVLPLSHVTAGIREEWLGANEGHVVLWVPIVVTLVALGAAGWVSLRRAD